MELRGERQEWIWSQGPQQKRDEETQEVKEDMEREGNEDCRAPNGTTENKRVMCDTGISSSYI